MMLDKDVTLVIELYKNILIMMVMTAILVPHYSITLMMMEMTVLNVQEPVSYILTQITMGVPQPVIELLDIILQIMVKNVFNVIHSIILTMQEMVV